MTDITSHEGTIRGIGVYPSDNDYTRHVACPAFIELTKKWDDNIRSYIVNMKNEVIIPADYICFSEIRNSDNVLIGFKAVKPKHGDYIKFDLTGNILDKGNTIVDEQMDEYLDLMCPSYQSELHRSIEKDAWISHMEELDDNLYDNYDDLY